LYSSLFMQTNVATGSCTVSPAVGEILIDVQSVKLIVSNAIRCLPCYTNSFKSLAPSGWCIKIKHVLYTGEYPKVSGLAACSENCKWYSSLPLGAVVSLFCESVLVSFVAITLCVASQRVLIVVYFVIDSVRKLLDTPSYIETI
jgi:hypothetical protein